MQSVEAVLLQRVRLTHTRVTGDACTRYDHEMIGRARDGELLQPRQAPATRCLSQPARRTASCAD